MQNSRTGRPFNPKWHQINFHLGNLAPEKRDGQKTREKEKMQKEAYFKKKASKIGVSENTKEKIAEIGELFWTGFR